MTASFEFGAYAMSLFLTVYGFLFIYLSTQEPPASNKNWFTGKVLFAGLALVYLGVAHFTVYMALNYNIEYGNQPACENVVNTSNYLSSTVTQYTWINTCDGRDVPAATTTLFTAYSWILWMNLMLLMLGSIILTLRWVTRW